MPRPLLSAVTLVLGLMGVPDATAAPSAQPAPPAPLHVTQAEDLEPRAVDENTGEPPPGREGPTGTEPPPTTPALRLEAEAGRLVLLPEKRDTRGPLFHPDGPGRRAFRLAVGAFVDILPSRVVESEQRQLPRLEARARYGLPWGLSVSARANTLVVTNQVELGLLAAARVGRFSFMVMDHQGGWYGALTAVPGFQTASWGFVNMPGVGVGIPYRDTRFSLSGELLLTFGQGAQLGDEQRATRGRTAFAGTQLTLVVENILDAGGIVYFGVAAHWVRPDYQLWLAFSDERARVWHPRLLAGYVF
jgi:hypothetical protein